MLRQSNARPLEGRFVFFAPHAEGIFVVILRV
jgi:hypothetical protein